ncbi:uncharacterized protein LOC121601832 [Anopheles merus]|uniref:uncharacterized protein LOC121601832 n=1 Tax=Anopheles merus TaxID=30066 RepID=UPI001BE41914|nr:uncharacterized protein LOC121601832 [Anopheles merus]
MNNTAYDSGYNAETICPCRRCLGQCVVLCMIRQFSSILKRGFTRNHLRTSPEAVRRRVELYQHKTPEAQLTPGAPIAPDGVERARSQRPGQEFNPSDHYPLPHNSCSSNRTKPTALLIAVKFPGRRKNPTNSG